MRRRRMRNDERCLDCEKVLEDAEGGGSPREPYGEGFHVCGKSKPRVTRAVRGAETNQT